MKARRAAGGSGGRGSEGPRLKLVLQDHRRRQPAAAMLQHRLAAVLRRVLPLVDEEGVARHEGRDRGRIGGEAREGPAPGHGFSDGGPVLRRGVPAIDARRDSSSRRSVLAGSRTAPGRRPCPRRKRAEVPPPGRRPRRARRSRPRGSPPRCLNAAARTSVGRRSSGAPRSASSARRRRGRSPPGPARPTAGAPVEARRRGRFRLPRERAQGDEVRRPRFDSVGQCRDEGPQLRRALRTLAPGLNTRPSASRA